MQSSRISSILFKALLIYHIVQGSFAESLLSNTNPVGSLHNPMKLKYTTNTAVNGTPIAVHPSPTSAHCAYECRKHLQCRKATFWKSHTCHIHSRKSINGMYVDDEAVTIDYMDDTTHILIIGGKKKVGITGKVLEFIPESKAFNSLNTVLDYPRRQHYAVVYDSQILVDAGYASDYIVSTEVFSGVPLAKKHPSISSYPRYVSCGGIAKDKFYHCFGKGAAVSQMSHCDVYDLKNGYAHTRLETNIAARNRVSCVFKGNDMYVIGGYIFGTGYIDEVYKIDLGSGNGQALSSYPMPMHFTSSVWYKGDIIVCGGQDTTSTISLVMCKKYILSTNQWVNFPNLKIERCLHNLVNWGTEKILAIGGVGTGFVALSSIEVYENGVWREFADLPYNLSRMAVVNLDEYLNF